MASRLPKNKHMRLRFPQVMLGVSIAILFVNLLVLAQAADIIKFPGDTSSTTLLREAASSIVEYYETQSVSLGLDKNTAIRDALAKFRYEITKANTDGDVVYVIGYYSRMTADVLDREQDGRRRDTVLSLINQDLGNTTKSYPQSIISVYLTQDGRIEVDDASRILKSQTIENMKKSMESMGLNASIDVEVINNKASVVTARTIQDRLKIARDEIDSLRLSLEDTKRQAGLSPLTGRGIIVEMYDAPDGFMDEDVVEERDIRDVVNELFAAGASGVEVGGQRLTTTTPIRAAGVKILVNQQPISVDPVVIKAIGDADLLESSLDLLKNSLSNWGIKVSVTKSENISLSAAR